MGLSITERKAARPISVFEAHSLAAATGIARLA
jgi:hypothetical protein